MTTLRTRMDVVTLAGERALVVDCEIPASAPDGIREGMARRAVVNRGGTCPCGARLALPNRAQRRAARGRVVVAQAAHAGNCPAHDEHLTTALARWVGGRHG